MEPDEANKLVPEKIEDIKEEGPKFHCEQSNTEVVDKIAQLLLLGLATACVDNTTGALFAGPGAVAAGLRKEMEDYLTQRSETFVAESVVLEGGAEVSDDPYDIISNFVEDFTTSKRTLFGRVSTWMLSDQREDKIDDFVQEMEINGFWLTDKRAILAQTLLKNVDFKTAFHCDEKFDSLDELSQHLPYCKYRSMTCQNESCDAVFSACHLEDHDSICPFKFIPCEQKCSQTLMRRDMDRHCITVCPMRLVNCPFHSVGCQLAIPHSTIEQHCASNLHPHLLYILQGIYKEASADDLEQRINELEKASSHSQLANARDIRSLTSIVKRLDSKLGPMKFSVKVKNAVEDNTDDRDICKADNIENKDNSNVKNRDVKNNDAEERDDNASNHVDNNDVNNGDLIKNDDSHYSSDIEIKDSNNGCEIENMHVANSKNIDKNQNSNGNSFEIKDDSYSHDIEKKHGNNRVETKNNDGTDGSSNIENKNVNNIGDIENNKHDNNSSNIENSHSSPISHMDDKQSDDSSKVEDRDVNNFSIIDKNDVTDGSNKNEHGSNGSNVENRDGSNNTEIEDKHDNESSKVEKRDFNNISSIANSDGSNADNVKEDDNYISNFDDRYENKSSNIENKGGNNSHEVNNKHDS